MNLRELMRYLPDWIVKIDGNRVRISFTNEGFNASDTVKTSLDAKSARIVGSMLLMAADKLEGKT